jgi:hypothetical protein
MGTVSWLVGPGSVGLFNRPGVVLRAYTVVVSY